LPLLPNDEWLDNISLVMLDSYEVAADQEVTNIDVLFGSSCFRPEWTWTALVEQQRISFWHQMAKNLLTVAQITREAIQLWANTNRFLQRTGEHPDAEFGIEGAQQRARLPLDFTVCDVVSLCQDTAHLRSMELLKGWLDEHQRRDFEEKNYFEVVGSASGRKYRLHPRYSYGIEELEGAQRGDRLCVVPSGALALGDILLAQKIGLETSERRTLWRANRSEWHDV
jgi:hypothetical protein